MYRSKQKEDNIMLKRAMLFLVTMLLASQSLAMGVQQGKASYYHYNSPKVRLTANGEKFDSNKLTAAHKTLPFGTKVKVTNLKNNKSIIVMINDRGPFIKSRVIDVTKHGAEKLDFIKLGVVPVKLEVVKR